MYYLKKGKEILINIKTHLNEVKKKYLELIELIKEFHLNESEMTLEELEKEPEFIFLMTLIKNCQDEIDQINIQIEHF